MATSQATVASPSTENPSSPAAALDSAEGWLVVAATFISTFTAFGVTYSFGTFFDAMGKEFGTGRGPTALMFSFTALCYYGLGPFSGKLADRFGPRPVVIAGAIAVGLGLFATSRANSIVTGYLTYAAGVGICVTCSYVPMMATVSGWFVRRRTAALGVAVAGMGIGTQVMAPVSAVLIENYGWRDAYVILGVGGMALLLLASVAARRPPVVTKQQPRPLRDVVMQRRFLLFYIAFFLTCTSMFVPFVFLKSYAVEHGVGVKAAAILLGFLGGASVAGRLGLGALGTRHSAIRLLQLCFGVMAASFPLWWLAGGNYALLTFFAIVFGIGYGGIVALTPAVMATMFGTQGLGVIMGAFYTSAGLGGLVGPPMSGFIVDRSSYGAAIWVVTAIAGVATLVLVQALPPARATAES